MDQAAVNVRPAGAAGVAADLADVDAASDQFLPDPAGMRGIADVQVEKGRTCPEVLLDASLRRRDILIPGGGDLGLRMRQRESGQQASGGENQHECLDGDAWPKCLSHAARMRARRRRLNRRKVKRA